MRRAISLLIVLVAGVALAWWLAALGGTVEIRVQDAWIGLSLPILLLLLALLFIVLLAIASLIGWLRRMPARLRQRRALRQRSEGDAAVTRVLIALAAGTADTARLEARRARTLLGETPQVLLLTAEAERLAGREEAAAEAFAALAERPDARFLGLRGLLRQAMAREDWEEAKRLAREAEAAQPGAGWIREERAQLALRTQDWREALSLAPPDAPRAALSLAAAGQEPDPAKAAELERKAFQADPGFAPAALAHAARQRAAGSPRRARATLEEAWAVAPHPDLAAPLLEGVTEPLARVKAVEQLIRRNPQHPESRLLLARIALEAGLTGRARQELDALRAAGQADRRAYLLLAELEEAEHGDAPESRAAQSRWLREGALAAPEPRWRCGNCGTDHTGWKPVCSACNAVGQIAWTKPTPAMPAAAEA
ncbi:tetratricopeptide repeat protein [Roseomonas sp. NAR14]|uniref:Tetratricopeptide repeat protein n=1 Tax=Roseomonas acroporae TaxID=2937791 RepID=A0A9X1Y8Z2_9PROT|nr:heme biosynthesis HemY N-terminal domain-containing protein [Roseomonas acroporae]MCK8785275.1 tetratricopeptide repeat protein [Roseomonas acroporae]